MESTFIDREVEVFTNDDGHYKGLVVSINKEKYELVLRKVKDMKTGKIGKKTMHFYKDHILNITLQNDDRSDETESKLATELPTDKSDLLLDPSDDGPSLFQSRNTDYDYLTDYEPPISNIELTEPPETMLINEMGAKFAEAISEIRSQKVVSFAVEGKRVIRKGEISLIVIGTRQLVYLFDIRYLGSECITQGLKEVIESQNILKVVFDIRMVSDCLYSLYNIEPRNVFDCQVADIFVHKRKYGTFPSEVATLSDCLQKYRNMPRDQCSFERAKMKMTQPNSKVWNKRPFPEEFLRLCYTNAMYIRELRLPMIEQLLGDYLTGVNVYLDCVRSSTDNAVKHLNTRKIPKSIYSISAFKDKKIKMKRPVEPAAMSDENSDVDVYEDRGSWSVGTTFSERYQEKHGAVVECKDTGRPLIDLSKPILKSAKGGGDSVKNTTDSRDVEYVHKTHTDNVNPTSEGKRYISPVDRLNLNSNDISSSLSYNQEEEKPMVDMFSSHTLTNDSCRDSNSPKLMTLRKPYIDESRYSVDDVDSCDEERKGKDEYQISTSELDSEDSEDFFLSSINDPPRVKQEVKLKDLSDEKEWPDLPRTDSPADRLSTQNYNKDSIHYSDQLACTSNLLDFPSLNERREKDGGKVVNGQRSLSEMKNCTRDIKPPTFKSNSFDEIRSKTPEYMDGVQKSTKPKFSGRGQTLQVLAQHSKKTCAATKGTSPRYLHEGKHHSYSFPSDDELMKLPCVAPMVGNTPIRGELVNVTKIYHSS